METIRYSPIGKEDCNFGTGTFEVTLADGRVVMLSQIDVGAILNSGLSTMTLTGLTLNNTTLGGTTSITTPTFVNATLTTPTINTGILNTSTVGADPTAALGIASKQYVDYLTNLISHTANGTIAQTTRTAVLSGASFTLNLNSAVGHTGQMITFIHNGTSLTQVYTIDGAGSETFEDGTGPTTTYILYTKGERLTVVSDGANWLVLEHQAETVWTDAGVMTILGSTSNPTKATTPDYDHVFWRRQGKDVHVKWVLQISSSAGAADGSGAYLFEMPSGIAIDAVIPPINTAWATATMSEGIRAGVFGMGKIVQDSTAQDNVIPFAYDTTHLQWIRDSSTTPLGSAAYAMTTAELGYYLEAHFPAANWRS